MFKDYFHKKVTPGTSNKELLLYYLWISCPQKKVLNNISRHHDDIEQVIGARVSNYSQITPFLLMSHDIELEPLVSSHAPHNI